MNPQVGFFCPECARYNLHEFPPRESDTACAHCGRPLELRPSAAVLAGAPVDRCPLCGNLELFTRKDFPQQLGCAAVTLTVLLSTLAYAFWGFLASLVVLVLASAVDFVLYHRLREVTVCYRCHAELRGFAPNPSHQPFDLSRAEEYEHGS